MATQYFKRNLLLNLCREGKKNRLFVSSCHLREIKMSDTCRLFWRPLAFLPVTLSHTHTCMCVYPYNNMIKHKGEKYKLLLLGWTDG